jgi:hypothetical protein
MMYSFKGNSGYRQLKLDQCEDVSECQTSSQPSSSTQGQLEWLCWGLSGLFFHVLLLFLYCSFYAQYQILNLCVIQFNQYSVSFRVMISPRVSADSIAPAPANEAIEYEKQAFNKGVDVRFRHILEIQRMRWKMLRRDYISVSN